MNRRRAVSDVVGFILVFSLITTTVGVVYVVGFQGLTDARDAERVNNAERAFDVMAHNVEDIHRDGAPGRSTEVKLADAQLSFGEETTVEWCWDADDDGSLTDDCGTPSSTNTETLRPVVFEADGAEVVYENGAVIRAQGDGAVVRREPGMLFRDAGSTRTVVLPTVAMTQDGTRSVGGDTTVLVRTQLQAGQGGRSLLAPTPTTADSFRFTIDTAPNRAEAWERYLDDEIPDSWNADACTVTDPADGVVECEFEADRTLFPVVRIDATFA
jgi:hypothetical protein